MKQKKDIIFWNEQKKRDNMTIKIGKCENFFTNDSANIL